MRLDGSTHGSLGVFLQLMMAELKAETVTPKPKIMDALQQTIQEIKEALKMQTEHIKLLNTEIKSKEKLLDSICDNYLSFIQGISYLPLPTEIVNQTVKLKELLNELKAQNTPNDADEDLEINEVEDISELINKAHERSEGMER